MLESAISKVTMLKVHKVHPDLIWCVYHFWYNSPRAILKAIRAGVGFGSGTETNTTHAPYYPVPISSPVIV